VQRGTCIDNNDGMRVLGLKPLSLTCIMILFVNHKSTNPKISQFLLRLPQLHQVFQIILLWHAFALNPHQWNLQLLVKCIKFISQSIHKSKVVVVTFQLSIANRTYIFMIFASNVELWFSNSSFLMGKWILSSLHITNQWNQGDYIMNNISYPFTMKRIKSLMNLNYEGSLFCNPYDDKKYCMIVNALTITSGFSSYFLWPYLQ
jgi:hypothetical protein